MSVSTRTASRMAATMALAATALGVAAVSAPGAGAAPAGGQATAASVPWKSVGAQWVAGSVTKGGVNNLVLVSPTGQSYRIATMPAGEVVVRVSNDVRHVLTSSTDGRWRVRSLTNGAVTATLPRAFVPNGFTRPSGTAIEGMNDVTYERYSVTGQLEKSKSMGQGWFWMVPSPNGLFEASIASRAGTVKLYEHGSMNVVRTFSKPTGAVRCWPAGWESSSSLLEACSLKDVGQVSNVEVYRQNVNGSKPIQLTWGTYPGDGAAKITPEGFVDVDSTSIGAVATANYDFHYPGPGAVFRLSGGRVTQTLKPAFASDVAASAKGAHVIGNRAFFFTDWFGTQTGKPINVASLDVASKHVNYLLGAHSQFGGSVSGFDIVDPAN